MLHSHILRLQIRHRRIESRVWPRVAKELQKAVLRGRHRRIASVYLSLLVISSRLHVSHTKSHLDHFARNTAHTLFPTVMKQRQRDLTDPLDEILKPPPGETEQERLERVEREENARRVSNAIDESLRAERLVMKKRKVVRLLLLGQSESGMFANYCSSQELTI